MGLERGGLERGDLLRWQPMSPNFRILRQLTRERGSLVDSHTRTLNIQHAYKHQGKMLEDSVERTKEHLAFLDKQIAAIEKEITKIVNSDSELKKRLSFVTSIPGVARLTAVTIAAETNGFAAIHSAKQLASYAGLDVKIRESGKWKGKEKISKQGNKYIRKAMYCPTMSKIRWDKPTKEKYEQLKAKKGIPMVAIVANHRKLLILIYTLWNKQEMFKSNIADEPTSSKVKVQEVVTNTQHSDSLQQTSSNVEAPEIDTNTQNSNSLQQTSNNVEAQILPLDLTEKQGEKGIEKGEKNVGIKVPTLQDRPVQNHAPSLPLDGTKVKTKVGKTKKDEKKMKEKG
jgi:hypothetical protein